MTILDTSTQPFLYIKQRHWSLPIGLHLVIASIPIYIHYGLTIPYEPIKIGIYNCSILSYTSTVSCAAFFTLFSSFLLFNRVGHALFQRLSLPLLSLHLPACTSIRCKYVITCICMYIIIVQKSWKILTWEYSITLQSQASALQPNIGRINTVFKQFIVF